MKTGIVELLNAAGYKNTNTRRERAVKNLNLLIESGVASFQFIHSDEYNAKENGRGFWMVCDDGKKRPTAYKVTLYGKTYYGHTMIKSSTKRYVAEIFMDGTRRHETITDYYDNTRIDISEIQSRVARLLSIISGNGDFLKSNGLDQLKGECSCNKCNGLGIIPAFSYYANGICFDCGGVGVERGVLKNFIAKNIKVNSNQD